MLRRGLCPLLIASSTSDPSSQLLPVVTQGGSFERRLWPCWPRGQSPPPPPPSFYSHLFVVWKTSGSFVRPISRWRPVSRFSSLFGGETEWSHRPEGCIPSGPFAPGQLSLLAVCGRQACLPVSSALFWPLHSSESLHQGHGSCLAYSPSYGDKVAALPRRLAHSCLIPSGGSAGKGHCSVSLSPARDCRQSPEVGSRAMSDGHLL